MNIIADLGAEYGLELNWKKVEFLPIRCDTSIRGPDGSDIKSCNSIQYLGAMLSGDGKIDSELGRRLAIAAAEFKIMKQIWNHCSLTRWHKLQVYIYHVL